MREITILNRRAKTGHLELAVRSSAPGAPSTMVHFRLRFPELAIAHWAGRYSYPGEAEIEEGIAPAARSRGYLMRDEFLAICRWKTPRSQPRCARNRSSLVEEVTRVA